MKLTLNHDTAAADIFELHKNCFPTDAEAVLVRKLAATDIPIISITAIEGNDVIGHALFSQMQAPFPALGLAPVSVCKQHRCQGLAAQMIKKGLQEAIRQEWQAVFVLGDPQYYQRFGFSVALAEGFSCAFQGPCFMALPIGAPNLPSLTGDVSYAAAFSEL